MAASLGEMWEVSMKSSSWSRAKASIRDLILQAYSSLKERKRDYFRAGFSPTVFLRHIALAGAPPLLEAVKHYRFLAGEVNCGNFVL